MPSTRSTQTRNKPRLSKRTRGLRAVKDFTRKLFKGPVTVRQESDPEFPSKYFVVSVKARGSLKELLALNHQWHRDLGEIARESADQYRLSLDLQ